MAAESWEAWSGKFWANEEGTGFMSVHYDDQRLHKPPEGWDLIGVRPEADDETYIYRRNTESVPPVPVSESDQLSADV